MFGSVVILVFINFFRLTVTQDYFCSSKQTPLTYEELDEKYDGIYCDRKCDGIPRNCHYKFVVENFNTMGGACGDCALNVTADCFQPGCIIGSGSSRNVMAINRQIPAPPIHVCENDRIVVELHNKMSGSAVTIHWHGFHQRETPWMDGVPMVTQCPIFPHNKFRYVFMARQTGTHYYHGHTGLHRTEGLFGQIIVRANNDVHAALYDIDDSAHSLIVTDWMKIMASEFDPGIVGRVLRPDALMMNGLACNGEGDSNCDTVPISVFYLEHDKTGRFRIDNAGSHNCPTELTAQDLEMKIIASDSFPVEPTVVDKIVFYPGERYDVLIKAPPDGTHSYLRGRLLGACAAYGIQTYVRLVYVTNQHNYTESLDDRLPHPNPLPYDTPFKVDPISLNAPQTLCTEGPDLCTANLVQIRLPLYEDLRERIPDVIIPMNFGISLVSEAPKSPFLIAGTSYVVPHINSIVSVDTSKPGLTSDKLDEKLCNADNLPSEPTVGPLYSCPHVIPVKLGSLVELRMRDIGNPGTTHHPFHLHGFAFQVIDQGTALQFLSGETPYLNATHAPPLKDTVAIPSGGYVIVRFIADNPGWWFSHCHFEWHMHIGMRLTFKVGKDSDMVPAPKGFPKCGHFLPNICDLGK